MLIHLGKVYLGQSDKIDLTTAGQPLTSAEFIANPRDEEIPPPAETEGVRDE